MREVKFRAWDKTKQRFTIDNDMLAVTFNGDVIHASDTGIAFRNDLELMQYTGLKDKNGVEIYEGDILQHYAAGYHFGVFAVKWEDTGFWNVGINEKESEVIGNIYENPELLKED